MSLWKEYREHHETGQIRLPACFQNELHIQSPFRAQSPGPELGKYYFLYLYKALTDGHECGVRGQKSEEKVDKKRVTRTGKNGKENELLVRGEGLVVP